MSIATEKRKIAFLKERIAKKTSSRTSKKAKLLLEKARMEAKWYQLHKLKAQKDTPLYSMRNHYEEKNCIIHPVLGWGFVLKSQNNRVDVLFKIGVKSLISNQT